MLEDSMTSGIEKTASEKEDKAEVPSGSEQFTKTASAIKEAEELGAKVATQLLKQAEDEKKEESKDEKKEESKDEGDKETKDEAKEEGESEEEEAKEKSKEEDMDKKANLVDIISAMLEKSAFEGDENTQNGVPGGVVPNKMQVDNAANVAYQDATIGVTPGTNGNNDGGTVNQIMDAIVAKAQGAGGIGENQVPGGTPFSGAEAQDPNVEKTAAVVALVESGIDFDTAVDLVKQAEVEIKAEAFEVEKQAAFGALIEAGVDFDTATNLVKEACEGIEKAALSGAGVGAAADKGAAWIASKAKGAYAKGKGLAETGYLHGLYAKDKVKGIADKVGPAVKKEVSSVRGSAQLAKGQLKDVVMGTGGGAGYTRLDAAKGLAKNKAVHYGAGAAALAGAGGYAAYQHQKKAAVDILMADGFDFDTAVQLVQDVE